MASYKTSSKADRFTEPNDDLCMLDPGNFRHDAGGHVPDAICVETSKIDDLTARGFSRSEIETIVVPRRTLDRRRKNRGRLSLEESDKALRLERIHAHAMRVFGDMDKANRWLRKPCRAMNGVIPMDLLISETGAHLVEAELHAIDHGMFA